jgi:SAM-dependent methyltransferase
MQGKSQRLTWSRLLTIFRQRVANVGQPHDKAFRHTAFSCVVDDDALIVAQSYIWLNCLLYVHGLSPEQIYVHVVRIEDRDYLKWLESLNVNIVRVQPFDERNPYCNKLTQLSTFPDSRFQQVVLMDCDTAWVGRQPLPVARGVAAKIVDFANPPPDCLATIFDAAGLGMPRWTETELRLANGECRTDYNNCNGGLYIFEPSFLKRLAPQWLAYALWCLDHVDLFGEYSIHVDQIAFALAMRRLGAEVEPVSSAWNYPTHVDTTLLPEIEPEILHYHRQLTSDMKLAPTGRPVVDAAIGRLNSLTDDFLKRELVNSVFWNLRYRVDPERGSGLGSRGEMLAAKRALLGHALTAFDDKDFLDIGCGDLEATRDLELGRYTGVDVAKDALRIAQGKRPDWQFTTDWTGREADVVMCLDVLIHQSTAESFNDLLHRLVSATRERLIVTGYNSALRYNSAIVAFHRPILDALRTCGEFNELSVIGGYRDVELVVADKRRFGAAFHPNDMEPDDFNLASTLTHRPDLLRHLADLSRVTFGFYTKHFPRALEYPWLAERLEDSPPGTTILDIGAGLNPLPMYFAWRGAIVHCLDSHPTVRTLPAQPVWNEWGFFDYAVLHPNLTSHHIGVEAFEPSYAFDAIYSVSVLEHLPRAVWEKALQQCRRWLAPAGRLLLTFDLVPGTNLLWNYAEGREVEPTSVHGDLDAIVRHLEQLGFALADSATRRHVPHSRTDLAFLDCSLRC